MNLSQLRDAFKAEVALQTEIKQFTMDDDFTINAKHNISYPMVHMPIPDSTKLFSFRDGQKGYESFAVPFTVYDKQLQLDADERIDRISELELIANKIFRDIAINNADIIDFTVDALTIRGTHLHNDRLLGVRIALTLTVFTGWDCET